jgi:cytochrome c553
LLYGGTALNLATTNEKSIMTSRTQKGFWAIGLVVVLFATLAAFVYLASEARITARYTLPSSIMRPSQAPDAVRRGAHLAMIYGCEDCHTASGAPAFTGQVLHIQPGLTLAAPNLRRFLKHRGPGLFDIALRRALTPGAQAVWDMPSNAYVYMRDQDIAALLAYFASLPVIGNEPSGMHFSFRARLAVLAGTLRPANPYGLGLVGPRQLGPAYDGGRYLAMMSCSGCHGADLDGKPGDAPDLRVIQVYDRPQFFALLRQGVVPRGRSAPVMAKLARRGFQAFKDYEINALYDYLKARAKP